MRASVLAATCLQLRMLCPLLDQGPGPAFSARTPRNPSRRVFLTRRIAPQLASTEEYIDGQFTGNLGEVLIRCAVTLLLLHGVLLTPRSLAQVQQRAVPACSAARGGRGRRHAAGMSAASLRLRDRV